MKIRTLISMLSCLSLMGCSSILTDSDCPIARGIACQSLKTVDHLADQGYFDEKGESTRVKPHSKVNKTQIIPNSHPASGRVLKIWFSPHVDSHNNFHEERIIYAVVSDMN